MPVLLTNSTWLRLAPRQIVGYRSHRRMAIDTRPVAERAGAVLRTASLFRGLADPTRLQILLLLHDTGELRVVDLVTSVGLAQSTVSAHLACLRDCGLVTSRSAGRQSLYRLAVDDLARLLDAADRVLAATGDAPALCATYGIDPPRTRR